MPGKKGLIIAIDGPAGVGKSSVGNFVASELGYGFINTGEMYRALAWKALQHGVNLDDEKAVYNVALSTKWEFRAQGTPTIRTFIDGRLMGQELRLEEVSRASSHIAKNAEVRGFMKQLQRDLGQGGAILMEGRDIGTVVFPDADLKIYLDATPQKRADRRYKQLLEAKLPADYDEILKGIISRDANDSGRRLAPLKKAADSVVVDTSELTLEDVSRRILKLVKEKCSTI